MRANALRTPYGPPELFSARLGNNMRLLELFSGTGSVGKVARQLGVEVVSLDFDRRCEPDICEDILRWDYKAAYAPGHFDIVWASPD